jgi:class 3 adenylate cyclase
VVAMSRSRSRAAVAPSDLLTRIRSLDVASLYALWRSREDRVWDGRVDTYIALARALLARGEAILAYDVLREGLARRPQNRDLECLMGLALARCHASEQANLVLTRLYESGKRDEETVSLLARTHKDLWLSATEREAARKQLRRAAKLYAESFQMNKRAHYWSGINAATLALALGRKAEATVRAQELQAICQRKLAAVAKKADERYWILATLGEACLILGDIAGACRWYRKAQLAEPGRYGDHASTRRNARLILAQHAIAADILASCLPAPQIVVFSGHRIDRPGTSRPRFSPEMESKVLSEITSQLRASEARVGFSSAALGADILFLEAMLGLGGEVTVVLPSPPRVFAAASVEEGENAMRWRSRFDSILRRAKDIVVVSDGPTGSADLEYANVLSYGLAKSQCRETDGNLGALCVWDGTPGPAGGTASAVELWRSRGQLVRAIHPRTLNVRDLEPCRTSPARSEARHTGVSARRADRSRRLVSILFADAVGYSKLAERQVPAFVEHFLGLIAELLAKAGRGPIVRNTWGDAIYLVFDDVRAAGLVALAICERIAETNWLRFGLPEAMNIRLALHSGPAFPITDPVIRQFSYTGSNVSRAARIEPITPPGLVYASKEFAALSEAAGVVEFFCEYVGRTSLAKHFGEFPTYRVRRSTP